MIEVVLGALGALFPVVIAGIVKIIKETKKTTPNGVLADIKKELEQIKKELKKKCDD